MKNALHLSETEKETIITVFTKIKEELQNRIDDFSQDVIISLTETLLNYSNRFYKRQFITRKAINAQLLQKLEDILATWFNEGRSLKEGIHTVQYVADSLAMSPGYLSDMLRSLTGQSAQQHIHLKLIAQAKLLLSTTSLTVAEIGYKLGFEHPQSFSKLFRNKTRVSPIEFRRSFN